VILNKQNDFKQTNNDSLIVKFKDILCIIQYIATIFAIIAALIWFLAKSEASQRANIYHEIVHKKLDDNWIWIHISITIENIGKIPLDLKSAIIRIHKLLPLDSSIRKRLNKNKHPIFEGEIRVTWPIIDTPYILVLNRKIDPGEKDNLDVEFIIPSYIKTIRVYSYFERQNNPPLGWSKATIYDIEKSN